MSVSVKLVASFVAITLLVIGTSWACIHAIFRLGQEVTVSSEVTGKRALLCGQLQGYSAKMRGALRGAILYSTKDMYKQEAAAQAARQFEQFADETKRIAAALDSSGASPSEREAARGVGAAADGWRPLAQSIVRLSAQGKFGDELTATTMRSLQLANQLDQATDVLIKAQTESFARAAKNSQSVSSRGRAVALPLIGLTLMACLAGFGTLRSAGHVVRDVAEAVLLSADQVRSAAGQVSNASQTLAQAAVEQAASLEETSAASNQISAMARKNSDSSQSAAELMAQSEQKFTRTNRSLDQMLQAIDGIGESGHKISKIIQIIDGIAFQTNILALNAAVEAARAGEAGMGFAVVADEVRNLAQRCAQAAQETAGLVQETVARSNDGRAKVDQVAQAIRAITSESGKVKTLVDDVYHGSAQQARDVDQISQSLGLMEQTTQTNAASSEESAAAAEELTSQAESVRAAISTLNRLLGVGT